MSYHGSPRPVGRRSARRQSECTSAPHASYRVPHGAGLQLPGFERHPPRRLRTRPSREPPILKACSTEHPSGPRLDRNWVYPGSRASAAANFSNAAPPLNELARPPPPLMSVTRRDIMAPFIQRLHICSPAHIRVDAYSASFGGPTNQLGRLGQVGGGRACSWIDSIPSPPESSGRPFNQVSLSVGLLGRAMSQDTFSTRNADLY